MNTGMVVRRALLVAYLAAAAANLAAVATGTGWLEWATKPLLMPLLAAYLLVRLGPVGAAWPIVVSLAFACGGDIALLFDGDLAFVIGMALFAGTHIAYLVAFVPAGALAGLRWWIPTLYGLAWLALVAVLYGRLATPMLVGLAVYGLLLFAMATAAAGLDARLGAGGLLFAASDVLIGLGAGDLTFTGQDVAVMALYAAGQAILVVRYAAVSAAGRARAGSR
jgi:uncharacterized membrane protein YhhN